MPRIRIPQELWDTIPAPAQAALLVVFAQMDQLEKRVADLEAEVDDLKAPLKQNSSNSSKPPSSDPFHVKRRPLEKPSGKKRGGQPGHERHRRMLVPTEGSGRDDRVHADSLPSMWTRVVGRGC
ncbi:hypothetical protein K2X85_10430 [bacterium]|nr:hypothetical protein [bacterium]